MEILVASVVGAAVVMIAVYIATQTHCGFHIGCCYRRLRSKFK